MSEIPVLPPEVISMILDFLTFRERLALATVSKQWHDLVFGPKLCQQQLVLRVSSTKGPPQPSLPVQRCRRVQVDCRGLDEEKVALGKRLLLESPVQHLAVIGSDLEMKWVLEECLSLMSRLVSLEVEFKSEGGATLSLANGNLESVTLSGSWKLDVDFAGLKSISIHQSDENRVIRLPNAGSFAEINNFHFNGLYQYSRDFGQVFEKMIAVKKVQIEHAVFESSQFNVLTSLTDLRLLDTTTKFAAWKRAVAGMKQLKTLHLIGCTFEEGTVPSTSFASDTVTEFNFYPGEENDVILPDFPNLLNMSYISNQESTAQMFEPICNKYQKLERLSFGMSGGQFGKFLTESCIAHINKLPSLKILQLVRMFLDNVNWSLCRNQLQKIRLVSSPIDGRAAQQLAATFPELRELFLDYGYLRQPAEAFEIAENFSEEQGLRRRLPRCRVSYYDCHVESLYDTCSGRRRDAGGVPSS
uniref:(northern house mosquito) hypothetical protein n=1 Tax=Culex pipiens TaxID=7175 RepID=A0A8D8BVP7_CULPI